jgi:phosphoglycolate phosphatase-like HAD superfamily hydrolase
MIALFWDIDGTLLSTGKAGVMPWEAAVREVTGHDFQLSSMRIPGLTDYQIAVKTFEQLAVASDAEAVERLVRLYEDGLPTALPLRQGFVMPNVREILEHFRDRPDVRSYLLTGNTRRGAKAKLTHYDLFKYFPDGGFAEDAGPRAGIARRALELARRDGALAEGGAFVIGDTPHDIECGHAIGARTIAVATGGYSITELTQHHPWLVVEQLPAPAEFERLIDEAVAAGPPAAEARA